MSQMNTGNEYNDDPALSSDTDSDDNTSESDCATHRSCSRYSSCNRRMDQYHSVDSNVTTNCLINLKPIKGDVRSVNNEPGHRQKFDGTKWRRICCVPHCLVYLNGGIYFDNWLCRKHYLMTIEADAFNESNNALVQNKQVETSDTEALARVSTRQSSKIPLKHKRGEIMVNSDGSRQKYDGQSWRSVCTYNDCKSYMVARGYCHRHDVEIRKKNSGLLLSIKNISNQPSISKSQVKRLPSSFISKKPRKGEIRLVRQEWNGTKWYSLCHHPSQQCQRRSAGLKYSYLCEEHYQDCKSSKNFNDKNDEVLVSPTLIRKKTINNDSTSSPFCIDESDTPIPYRSNSTNDQTRPIEQSIQTDVTYPVESLDLRQGCILIEDDHNVVHRPDSPQLLVYIKKEEDDYITNTHKITMNRDSLPLACKLEITKVELE